VERAARIAVLDFGKSRQSVFMGGRQVKSVRLRILEALPRTLILFGLSSLLALGAGVGLGALAARSPGRILDRSTTLLALLAEATPVWWMGSIFILVFAYYLPIFPHGAWQSSPPPEAAWALFLDRAAHLALPVLSVALIRLWSVAFLARNIILPVYHEDFVMAARGRGLSERRVILSHVLRTAAPGLVTTGMQRLLAAVAGDVLVEVVFSYPGIGFNLWTALRSNDIPMAAGILACFALLLSFALAFLDIFHGRLDPRSGLGRRA
jgi:peptide/nickel transport system permease protein